MQLKKGKVSKAVRENFKEFIKTGYLEYYTKKNQY